MFRFRRATKGPRSPVKKEPDPLQDKSYLQSTKRNAARLPVPKVQTFGTAKILGLSTPQR